MVYAQACAGDYSTAFTDYVQMAIGVCKHTIQGLTSEDDVAGEFLYQGGQVAEIGIGICEEFVHGIISLQKSNHL